MSRKPFIAGNWKMNKNPEEIKKLKKFASVREIVLKNQELYIR